MPAQTEECSAGSRAEVSAQNKKERGLIRSRGKECRDALGVGMCKQSVRHFGTQAEAENSAPVENQSVSQESKHQSGTGESIVNEGSVGIQGSTEK